MSNSCAVEIRAKFFKIDSFKGDSSELGGELGLSLNKVREEEETVNFDSTFVGKLLPRNSKKIYIR